MEMMMNGQSADSGCGAPCTSPSLAAAAGFAIEVRARRAVCARASPSFATWRGCRQTVFR